MSQFNKILLPLFFLRFHFILGEDEVKKYERKTEKVTRELKMGEKLKSVKLLKGR